MNFIVKRKVFISMLFLALSMLGYISYKQLDMEMIPNAELPMLFVQISSKIEVTPEYMEKNGVVPVESAVTALEDIELIESNAGSRSGSVLIYYEKNTDLKFAYLKLNEEIKSLSSSLPDEFNLQVVKVDLDMVSSNVLMNLEVRGSGGSTRVRNFVEQKVSSELENVDGVASVDVYGGKEKSVDILLNKAACDAYDISISRIQNLLSSNMQTRQYGGIVKENGMQYFVYLDAEYDNILQIENLVVGRGDNPILLKDIATINFGEKEEETISRVNGKEAVTVRIVNDAQANVIELSHKLRKTIAELNKEYAPYDIEIVIQDDSAKVMEDNINEIINLAIFGGLLAIFVLWVFLRNLRLVMIVALAMPISIYTAFNFFYAYQISINSLTLVGIALAIGMLLDTSVVVLENIYRLRTLGHPPAQAAIKGVREVWRSIVAATLTTITVFLPILFSDNMMIKLLGKHIGVSIISTLLVSLVVSLMLIPMLVHLLMSKRKINREVYQKVSLDNRGIRFYLLLLKASLRRPGATVISVLALFFITILSCMSVSVSSLEELETQEINLYVTMPSGSTLDATDGAVAKIEDAVSHVEEVEDVIAKIEEEEATITLQLYEDYQKASKRSFGEIQSEITKLTSDLTEAEVSLSSSSQTSSSGMKGNRGNAGGAEGFQKMLGIGDEEAYINIKGQDFELMVEVAEALESYIEELDYINSVNVSVQDNQPEVHLDFNALLMNDYGITQNEVASELSTFQTEVSSGVTYTQGTETYDIVIKYDDTYDEDALEEKHLDDLKNLGIPDSEDEALYELQSFSDIYYASGLREISRINQEKQIEVQYTFTDEVNDSKELQEVAKQEIEDIIESAGIPSGVAAEVVEEESQLEEFKPLILLAFLLIYMILATVFESFVTPFVLLFSIPFAAIGSFFFLTITGNSLFNANTLTGFLILLGVVVNNGIILLDFINVLRKNGHRRERAIIHAGLSRVRPILITTITTCVAMLPLALGDTEYVKAIGPPFAVTVIGGLSVSTLLTLIYIPMLYNALEQSLKWIGQLTTWIKWSLIVLVITGVLLAVFLPEKFLWQFAGVLLAAIGIPASFWFVTNSLRKSSLRIIPDNEALHIQIDNLVKVYGRENRMVRDYKAGKIRVEKAEQQQTYSAGSLFDALVWKLPLMGFLIYFTWFYLESGIWQIIASMVLCYYLIGLMKSFERVFGKPWIKSSRKLFAYLAPALFMGIYYVTWKNLALALIIMGLWYLALAIVQTGKTVKQKNFTLAQIRKPFRWFAKLIEFIPGVGHSKEQFKALRGVSLEMGTGMFGLLGPNGAGKSTMIRTICGILEQSYGKIWINGIDTQLKREELQSLIGYLPQEFGMYENMPAMDYLDYQAMLKGIKDTGTRKKRIQEVLESVHMWDNRNKKIGSFSGGMKQRIGIAQVLLHMPRILVVDEPTAGLDPRERIRFRNMLVELSKERIVIFSTHIIEDISSSCNTMAVINHGQVLYRGTPKDMAQLAQGKVWRFMVSSSEFKEKTKDLLVVHHMRDHDQIRVRCITPEKPYEHAEEEHPLLEDAYLWLLRNGK